MKEIVQLKRALAAKKDNRQSNRIRARSNLKSSRQEDEVDRDEEEDGSKQIDTDDYVIGLRLFPLANGLESEYYHVNCQCKI
jgi:hypothetical protein